nr:zinc finger, PMZ-type [Tanacetum cinerariifolium]
EDDNVVIKNLTTNEHFLNNLCSNGDHFRGFIDERVNANVLILAKDPENIDPKFNVKQVMTYLRHDPSKDWNVDKGKKVVESSDEQQEASPELKGQKKG